jgi:hypothetical protein
MIAFFHDGSLVSSIRVARPRAHAVSGDRLWARHDRAV